MHSNTEINRLDSLSPVDIAERAYRQTVGEWRKQICLAEQDTGIHADFYTCMDTVYPGKPVLFRHLPPSPQGARELITRLFSGRRSDRRGPKHELYVTDYDGFSTPVELRPEYPGFDVERVRTEKGIPVDLTTSEGKYRQIRVHPGTSFQSTDDQDGRLMFDSVAIKEVVEALRPVVWEGDPEVVKAIIELDKKLMIAKWKLKNAVARTAGPTINRMRNLAHNRHYERTGEPIDQYFVLLPGSVDQRVHLFDASAGKLLIVTSWDWLLYLRGQLSALNLRVHSSPGQAIELFKNLDYVHNEILEHA